MKSFLVPILHPHPQPLSHRERGAELAEIPTSTLPLGEVRVRALGEVRVREDYQKQGIASYLLEFLENIAKENQYKGFVATVLSENTSMIHVFRNRYPNAKVVTTGGEVTIQMDFSDAPSNSQNE